jgi:hypothetical protein
MRVCTLNPCYATLEPQGFLVERRRNGRGDLVGGIFDRIGRQMRIPRSSAPVFQKLERSLGCFDQSLAFQKCTNIFKLGADISFREADLTQPMYVGELLAVLLK